MAMELSYSILKRIGQMEICCTGLLIIDSLNFLNTNISMCQDDQIFFSKKKKMINIVLIWLENVRRPPRVWVNYKLNLILSILYYWTMRFKNRPNYLNSINYNRQKIIMHYTFFFLYINFIVKWSRAHRVTFFFKIFLSIIVNKIKIEGSNWTILKPKR